MNINNDIKVTTFKIIYFKTREYISLLESYFRFLREKEAVFKNILEISEI